MVSNQIILREAFWHVLLSKKIILAHGERSFRILEGIPPIRKTMRPLSSVNGAEGEI